MRTLYLLSLFILPGATAHAACAPDPTEVAVPCKNCGNLQQNPNRGFDNALNALLKQPKMRRELRLTGNTEVNLVNPLYASPGVTFYRVNINDPSWRVTDGVALAEAMSLSLALEAGLTPSLRAQVESQFEQSVSRAITYGSGPLNYFLEDQNGRQIAEASVQRNAGRVTISVDGPEADPQFGQPDCAPRDPEPEGRGNEEDEGDEEDEDSDNTREYEYDHSEDEGDEEDGDCEHCSIEDRDEETGEFEEGEWTDECGRLRGSENFDEDC